jgi:hypothetical protein
VELVFASGSVGGRIPIDVVVVVVVVGVVVVDVDAAVVVDDVVEDVPVVLDAATAWTPWNYGHIFARKPFT